MYLTKLTCARKCARFNGRWRLPADAPSGKRTVSKRQKKNLKFYTACVLIGG